MNILVIGSGGREHAIVSLLKNSKRVKNVYCVPGNAGIAVQAQCQDINLIDHRAIIDFARKKDIQLTIVGPEGPLSEGIVDSFQASGLAIFGPNKAAAQLESSKLFAKQLMIKYGLPTAEFEAFADHKKALDYLRTVRFPVVIKADGLAQGKGVSVCSELEQARQFLDLIFLEKLFKQAGSQVLIEECLNGPEVSILALTDGSTVMPLVSSQDHKRIFDADQGPNTGGMGAYSPFSLNKEQFENILDNIVVPVLKGLKKEGIEYKGVLYAGLMLTSKGPKVLEFNVRFGDPETQAVLPRLKTDLAEVFLAVSGSKLKQCRLEWDERSSVNVVLACGGYPGSYKKGDRISGLELLTGQEGIWVFHSGTKNQDRGFVTNSGRVLSVTALGKTVAEGAFNAYKAVSKINFQNLHFRKDIASKAASLNKGFDPDESLVREIN